MSALRQQNVLDKDSFDELLKQNAIEKYEVKVEDISDEYSSSKCEKCKHKLDFSSDHFYDHCNIYEIKISDLFNELTLIVTAENIKDCFNLKLDNVGISINGSYSTIYFRKDYIEISDDNDNTICDIFKVGEEKMKKIRSKILEIVKSIPVKTMPSCSDSDQD